MAVPSARARAGMHVQQPYLQLVAAGQPPQYQLYQPQPQPPVYQQQFAAAAQDQMLAQLMQHTQLMQQSYHPAGNAQLLGQMMATPLWGGQSMPSSGPIGKGDSMDADAIAARVLQKVRQRVAGGKVQVSAKHEAYDDGPLEAQRVGYDELKPKPAALSSRALYTSPDSVRSLASSIVDSVSDVLEEAERNRQAAERRAARAESIAEDAQRRLAHAMETQHLRRQTPSAEAVQPEPRRLTPPQRDEGPHRSGAPSAECSPGQLQSPDVTPDRRVPERSLRLSAASKQTRMHQEYAQAVTAPADTERQRSGLAAAAVGNRVPRHQRVADLQSWVVDFPVETKQQGTQTTGHEHVDDLTPVSRMKKLMEAVAAAEEKARVMGEETARARQECQTARARSASIVEQHDELKAMLAADARHAESQASRELASLRAAFADENARADGAMEQLRLAQSKVSELEDALMRERHTAATKHSEMQHETELAAKSLMLEERENWEQQRRHLENALQEVRQELVQTQRAQSVADSTVIHLTEEAARAAACEADAQAKQGATKTELETEIAVRKQAQADAERAMGATHTHFCALSQLSVRIQ